MRSSAERRPIAYGLFAARDADEMAQMLAETFCRRDPPAIAAGLTPPEFEAFVRLLCPTAAVEGLTIVARRADTGEMIGALLTEDGASGPPDGMNRLSRKFDPIFHILGQLGAEDGTDVAVRPGESLHLFLLGVAESAGGRGVAQHVFRKVGFSDRAYRSYREHRFEGRSVFASIAEHGGPTLMQRALST